MAVRGAFNGIVFEFETSPERESYEDFTPMEGWAAQVLAGYPASDIRRESPRSMLHCVPLPLRATVPPVPKSNVIQFPQQHIVPEVELHTPRGFRSYTLGPAMTLIVKGLQQVEHHATPEDWRQLHERVARAEELIVSLRQKIEEKQE